MKKYLIIILLACFGFGLNASTIARDTTKYKKVTIGKDCEKIEAIYVIIGQAIECGAPTYNDGNHLACYMIYEGAAYKILQKYGSRCIDISNLLEGALEKSYGSVKVIEKAWIMRMAFDQILGEPTKTK